MAKKIIPKNNKPDYTEMGIKFMNTPHVDPQKSGLIKKRLYENLHPYGYNNMIKRVYQAVVKNEEDPKKVRTDKRRQDAFNFYMGKPQENNTFSYSKYKPSKSKDKNAKYYSINDLYVKQNILNNIDKNGDFIDYTKQNQDGTFTTGDPNKKRIQLGDDIMGEFTVSKGEDEKGKYISYYDKWDIAPVDFGKPFEIYDRIYLDNSNNNQVKVKKYKKGGRLPILQFGGPLDLASSFADISGLSDFKSSLGSLRSAPASSGSGGLNMSFDPISMGLSTLTAIGGALGANMATKKAEMYDDASDNLQMIDVNKATKGSGLQSFLQNPLSLGIGGRKKAKLEAEEFNENMAKQLRNRNVASRFSTMSDAPTYTPVARQGGFIAYKGQTHEGPDGGILVDKFGNPTAVSQEESVASVEGGGKHKKGEVSYYDPESGSTYIYSDSLKFAKPANSILNKYKLTKPESLQYQQYKNDLLTQTMVKKKFENLTTAQEFAKENKMKAKDAINMFEKGGTLPTKRKVLMPKDNMEYDRDLRMNQDWMGSLKQAKDLDSMYATPVGTWKGNPMSLQQFTEMPEYVTNYYKPDYAIEFNKNRLGLPNTFEDINLGKIKQDPSLPRYQPASTITPGNEVAYYKKGGYVPMYEKGKKPKKSYSERSTGFIEDANEFIFDPVSAIMGLPSTKNIKGIGYDFIPGVGGATFGLRTFGKTKEYPKVPTPQAVAPYEVPNLKINPTMLPSQLPNAPTLDMPSRFANVSGLYDKKTNNAGPGYYNQGFKRTYDFGNMEPQTKTLINTATSNGTNSGTTTDVTHENTGMSPLFFQRYARGIRGREIGPQNQIASTKYNALGDVISGKMNEEDEYSNSWLNPAGHILSAAGAMADYAAMKKARPEDVNLGRVGAERISLARQRLANTRNAASARAMASSAARSSGMNAGVALSNTLAANTGANRLLGQQNAELLEREESTNAQMRQQANMVNAELAAQEGLFNTQQQNAYRMMMAQNNPLGNMARTAASYFADNAAYQQGYDTLQMLAPNAELYRDPDAKWKNNPFARPKVRLR